MKKIVLIEDMPWRARKYLSFLKNELNYVIEAVLFFQGRYSDVEGCTDLIGEMKKELATDIKNIIKSDFYKTVDGYYERNDVIILVDLDLKEDIDIFDKRINVQYTRSKPNNGKGKIWFYTTGDRTQKSMLLNNFPNQVIDVTKLEEDQLFLDDTQLKKVLM